MNDYRRTDETMDAIQTQVDVAGRCGRLLVALCALALATLAVPSIGFSQGDPTSSGGTQKPYIMILMDTSASMEWTDEGDEEYPKSEDGTPPWESGSPMAGQERYGSCYVWEIDDCDDYERPAWLPDDDWTDAYGDDMQSRLEDMQNNGVRLRNASQPRHVTLKEILTGEMVLGETNYSGSTDDLDPRTHGPGCWLVPRQRFATSQQQEEVCLGENEFEDFVDHREPRPHFQEVHDGQRANGLMDTVAGNAIFALAMFDGYKESHDDPEKGWKTKGHRDADDLNDPMKEDFAGIKEGSGDPDKDSSDDDFNYNLGVYQIISTKDMDVSTTVAGQISTFVQIALVDAGYLTRDEKHKLKPDKDDGGFDPLGELTGLDLNFSKDLKKYMDEHTLGRQPVAKATPYAAAIYDIHQFFAHGPKGKDSNESPVVEDPFKSCRPKHVIMLGDGHPEPELPGGEQVGGSTLNAAFGYDPARYPYSYTEDAIYRFMHDYEYDGNDSQREGVNPGDDKSYLVAPWGAGGEAGLKAAKFNPRVHVVGHNGSPEDGHEEELEAQIAHKIAAMASQGQSCASRSLGDSWIPESEGGDCELDERHCLDPRQVGYTASSFEYIDQTNSASPCKLPALLLTTKVADTQSASDDMADPVAAMAAALQLMVNDILASGVASRTRPTFVNQLDDPTEDVAGQYRFFSGMSIDTGRIFWRGLMYRRTNRCDKLDPPTVPEAHPIHTDIENLAGDDGDTSDSRRIFTVLADETSFDYDKRLARKMGGSRHRFMFGMDLVATGSDAGQFGSGYLSSEPVGLKDTRIPFEFDQLEAAVDNMSGLDLYEYFQTEDEDDLRDIIDEVRGRTALKDGAAFGAILNSSPVAVEPPALDLPIDSYREYKSLYGDRPSMVYVSTTDGLLHGIYTGALDGTTDDDQVLSADGTSEVSMHEQREAWAYLPQMLHNELKVFAGQQPNLLDGTPTVKDVRLCHKSKQYNQNNQACRYECGGDAECEQRGSNQWRTVLVAGRGQAGAGYFALDVSRPGGNHPETGGTTNVQAPDPIPLWEFDPNWERGQVYELARTSNGEGLVYPADSDLHDDDFIDECDDSKSDDEYFWDQPFLGTSVGEAAIGTVAVKPPMDPSSGDTPLRRAVAVFSGGNAGDYGTCDGDERAGRAIFVVDLQTGTLIRRFVTYFDEDGDENRFASPVNGSPALYDSSPGSLATRGFVGDGQGRLYRIDMSSEDPIDWTVRLFFDPAEDDDIKDDLDTDNLAPASHRPALALGTTAVEKDLLIFYGLGERGDLSAGGKSGAMIAVREKSEVDGNGNLVVKGERIWHVPFEDPADGDYAEQLTGEPIVFNSGVYFTTFVKPADDRCLPGWSRIYGMKFEGKKSDFYTLENKAEGVFVKDSDAGANDARIPEGTEAVSPDGDDSIWAFEPENTNDLAEDIIIRGLAITLGPSCSEVPTETGGGINSSSSQEPTLIAQSSSSEISGDPGTVGSGDDKLFTLEHSLPRPQSQNIPLSWSIIDN
jgi:hypothetical protein